MRPVSLLVFAVLATGCSRAQTGGASLVEAYPGLRFNQPVDLQAPRDGSQRLFVVEQPGRIRVFPTNAGTATTTTFLDLTSLVVSDGELGLLGLAFHPQYAQNGQFFVFYTRRGTTSQYEEVVARYRVSQVNPNVADPASAEILLTVPDFASNHNGGQLQFGPEGYLYVALGDGGGGGDPQRNGQNTGTLLGKILRLDVDNRSGSLAPECDAAGRYGIPTDNPFAGPGGGCGEIYAYGLRNPWRFSFGPDGTLWAPDVGQGAWEEVNKVVKGGNYGWNVLEGTHCYNAATCDTSGKLPPIYEYGHNSNGGFSITGGYVQPATGGGCSNLGNWYVFGDYVTRHIWALRERAGTTPNVVRIVEGSQGVAVSTFGLDPNGRLLVAEHTSSGRLMAFNCAALPVGVETAGHAASPLSFALAGVHPFQTTTALRLTVDRPQRVVVAVFDALGREVARLFDGEAAGTHTLTLDGAQLAQGVYAVRAVGEGAEAVVRVVRGR
ncbi:MAG TPA: PQQ-dependent sugar dehydrogenase [Rhodothermales bacterium]|nr:PQQ-dependent sugar dehydrogenase [Rhodothermales bacterium]